MKKIENYNLPEHTNRLYRDEAISSIGLTHDIAKKINELIDAYNEFSKMDLEWKQTQEGAIRKGVLYMKDNLINSLEELLDLFIDGGMLDEMVDAHLDVLNNRLENLVGKLKEGSTTADAELIDMRVDQLGKQHKTAGESVRENLSILFNRVKEIYLSSINFYSSFSNCGWDGVDVYNRLANKNYFNLDHDIKVTAADGYQVSVTVFDDNDKLQHDTGWNSVVIIPKGFNTRLSVRHILDDGISVNEVYTLNFEIDDYKIDTLKNVNFSYTSGGAFSPIRLNSGLFEVSKMLQVEAPEDYQISLRMYKNVDGENVFYKDTGWTSYVTIPIDYVCELSVRKTDNTAIYKNDLKNITIREGSWNSPAFTSANTPIFKDVLNSITYGGWNPTSGEYVPSNFNRCVSGVFKYGKTMKVKSTDPYTKMAVHTWSVDTVSSDSFVSDSGYSTEHVIPKNTYFTLYFATNDTTNIMQLREFECLNMTEYKEVLSFEGEAFSIVKDVAHRGYSIDAPENTLAAYKLAKQKGFKYVECDVSITSDGVPVLLHDTTINRTSNGTGDISSKTLSELKALDFGSWKGSEYAGEKIPTLAEFCLLCRNLGLIPYIEIKTGATENEVKNIVATVNRNGLKGIATYIAFDIDILGYVHTADQKARLGHIVTLVNDEVITNLKALQDENEIFIDLSYNSVTSDYVELCSNNNIPMEVWTVNSETAIKNFDGYITGFTSDYLKASDVLREV